jgi:hypothetical protein
LTEKIDDRLLRPIINACYPGTLSGLSLAVLEITGRDALTFIRVVLSLNALLFIFSAFFIFFYTIYHWRKWLWNGAAITFILGLCGSLIAAIWLVIA